MYTYGLFEAEARTLTADPSLLPDMQVAFLELLTYDGVSFPAAGQEATRVQLDNANKLDTFVTLALISKAGERALANEVERCKNEELPEEHPIVQAMQRHLCKYQRFVQTAMAVTEWGQPWQDLWAKKLYGESLQFPLTAEKIGEANGILLHPQFAGLRQAHFGVIDAVRSAVRKGIEAVAGGLPGVTDEHIDFAAQYGLYGRISPEEVGARLITMVRAGILPDRVNWADAVIAGVELASYQFES